MRKALTGLLTVLLVGILSAVVYAAVDASGGETAPAAGTSTTTTTTPDVGDARDTTTAPARPAPARRSEDNSPLGADVSGPCDEAEHANDPRCTGTPAQPSGRADNSGPGSRNSGPGSVNSGRDDDDDDRGGDDRSGPGHGGSGGGGDRGGSGPG